MHGEVRVTVIATGFDRAVTGDPRQIQPTAPGVLAFPTKRVTPPPPVREQRSEVKPEPPRKPATPATEVPDMEIPTFIRRQMD
jgi:hypothetical protein